jgi:hypothetical protein
MQKRGRKSAESLTAVGIATSIGSSQRLAAPVHLSDAEMSVWCQVVNDQPASSFTPTHGPMLEMYCRHVVQSRILADELSNCEPSWLATDDGLKRYKTLLGMHELECRAASSLATRLRITRQAIDQQTVARTLTNQSKGRKPWELPASA